MKRILTIAGTITVACTISILAYLKGHLDGVTQADVRSLSYEIPIFDDFDKTSADDAKVKLGHLIAFRKQWLDPGVPLSESWSYWRRVDSNGSLEANRPRMEAVASQYQASGQNESISEQVVAPNGP